MRGMHHGVTIVTGVDVNNEVDIVVRVEGQDVDISVIDDVEVQSESKL